MISDLKDMDSAEAPGCSNQGESSALDANTRVKQLALMNAPLHKLNEHLQQEISWPCQHCCKYWMCSLNSSELHMYTGLNCTAFSILRKRLEPILPSYGSDPEEIHQLCILNLPVR